jgi:cytochrome c
VRQWQLRSLIASLVVAFAGAAVAVALEDDDSKSPEATAAMAAAKTLGEKVWKDKALGTNDRSCSTCHDNPKRPDMSLKGVNDRFPRWDKSAGTVITLQEKFVQMHDKSLKTKKTLPLADERWTALEIYLRSL